MKKLLNIYYRSANMKRIIFLSLLLITASFVFSNEKVISNEKENVEHLFTFNIENSYENGWTQAASEFNYSDGIIKYAAKSSSSSSRTINLMVGVGFLVSGIVMVIPFSAVLIPVGVVLMTTPNSSWINAYGYAEYYVSQDQYNAGLACTILGGICFVLGLFVFLPIGIVNLCLARSKKSNNRRSETFGSTFALIADYKKDILTKKEEAIIGAKFAF